MRRARVAVGAAIALGVLGWWWFSGPNPGALGGADAGTEVVAVDGGSGGDVASGPARSDSRPSGDAGGAGTAIAGAGQVIARFGWGSGDDALGRERQQEGNPEAPMSLAIAPDGTISVLDQVNQRLVRLDANGKRIGSTPLPLQAAQDVVVTKDGTSLVIDRLVDKAVAIIGPDGKQRGELPIEGKGLSEGGASTGIFTDGDDVLVEREHGDLVRIGKTSGKADTERGEVPGRPSRDGASYLTVMMADGPAGLVTITAIAKANLEHRFTRQLSFGRPVMNVVMLDSDPAGLAYVGVNLDAPASTPERPVFVVSILCLDGRDGAILGRISFPANTEPDETFRELSVAGDGTIVFLRRTPEGAQLERHRCQ